MMKKALVALLLLVSLVGYAQTKLYLKGNIVTSPILLEQVEDQVWQSEVTLDDSRVFLFSDKYVYFEADEPSYKSNNIRINGGTYTVRFDMKNKAWSFTAPVDANRISAFGSSVCNGTGASNNKGYAYLYGEQLKSRFNSNDSQTPFYVSGIAIGGNTTNDLLNRYAEMTRDHARYVIIGLSMGNEGIHGAADQQKIFNQFANNMQLLIRKIKADGKIPVVMNNYTRADYTDQDYSYIKQMNLLIHSWDVSSVNTLGAIDDGKGHWATGYKDDDYHPTTAGHQEFLYAMTPSLFDAIASGKSQPVRNTTAAMQLGQGDVVSFQGEGTVHPFTISLRVKGGKAGRLLTLKATRGSREGNLTVNDEGKVVYTSMYGDQMTADASINDDQWHTITLTHYYAQRRVLLYVDNKSVEATERINTQFAAIVGDSTSQVSRQFSELFFWRSAFCPEEVEQLTAGKMLKSSLELYVPMVAADQLENKAMSLNTVNFVSKQTTGIRPAVKTIAPTRRYDLSGRAVNTKQKGIIVQNGRKYVL
ncbi:GDSL-type esterase/lipase family protein [Xylanibacter brevis]|uniref:GDSL-type esterase/lipase family protein n=1 Tax=Xylanibacter brevis TaxID=83231 RepID=UPI0009DD993D|nr:GDSL-type esterase/lipase family protein [Xylanibacter brevis]